MNELIKILFPKILTKGIIQSGFGPFVPSTLKAIQEGKCSNCLSSISDTSIFGNSLIVEDQKVKLICAKCRTGLGIDLPKLSSINRARVIIEMTSLKERFDLNWLQILLGLRLGYAFFQNSHKEYEKAFRKNLGSEDYYWTDHAPVNRKYGEIDGLSNCGECGAFWHNDYDKEKLEQTIELGHCWNCKVPNNFQWNMRTSYAKEEEIITVTNTVFGKN